MQKRNVRRSRAKKAVPRAGKRALVMDENLQRLIRREANKAKLSEEEYLRLAVNVSEMMRTSSVVPAGLFDSGLLKMILANPQMLNMLKGMIGNVWSKVGSGKEGSTPAAAAAAPSGPQMPSHPGMMPMRQPLGRPMGPRPYPGGAGMMHGMPGMMPGMGMIRTARSRWQYVVVRGWRRHESGRPDEDGDAVLWQLEQLMQ